VTSCMAGTPIAERRRQPHLVSEHWLRRVVRCGWRRSRGRGNAVDGFACEGDHAEQRWG
jgi:hypothetical protein